MFSERCGAAAGLLCKGKRELKRGRTNAARQAFRSAVDACPVSDRFVLGEALYWLGLCLLRSSKRDIAARSFASAQKMLRRGHARKTYLRLVNDYGMPRQKKAEDDDRLAFYSHQIALYLKRRSQRAFSSRMERDCVLSSLSATWTRIVSAPNWADTSASEKLRIFKTVAVSYPLAMPSLAVTSHISVVDFRAKRLVGAQDPCPCGSGLAYRLCCGRSIGLYEASNGYF